MSRDVLAISIVIACFTRSLRTLGRRVVVFSGDAASRSIASFPGSPATGIFSVSELSVVVHPFAVPQIATNDEPTMDCYLPWKKPERFLTTALRGVTSGVMASSPGRFAGGTDEAARAFLDTLLSAESFDRTALEGVKNVRFSDGRCRCSFPVRADKRNRYGTLHGGCIATLVDVISTAALITKSDQPGVSVNINVSYVSPGPAGEDVEVDATLVKLGANLAFMEVLLTSKDGKVVARGSHTKFLPGTNEPRRAKL
jgi:acyl-coenzyme A thioesterase 13